MGRFFKLISGNMAFVVVLAWLLLPYFAFGNIYRMIFFFAVGIIFICNIKVVDKRLMLYTLGFIFLSFLINFFASNSSYFLRHLQVHIMLVIILLSTLLSQKNMGNAKFLLLVILVFNMYTHINTIIGLNIDSHAARALAKSNEESRELTKMGIGGYGFVYFNALLYPLLLMLIKVIRDNKLRILAIVNIILLLITILKANYLLAISLILFQTIYLIIFYAPKWLSLVTVLSVVGVIIWASSNIKYIERKSFQLVQGTSLAKKHVDFFKQYYGYNSEYGSIDSRRERYTRSAKMMFRNPVIGVLSFNNVGKHSNILDMLAQYGFILGGLFVWLVFYIPIKWKKTFQKDEKIFISCFILGLFILGMVNNYAMQHGVLYIVLSLIFVIKKQYSANVA